MKVKSICSLSLISLSCILGAVHPSDTKLKKVWISTGKDVKSLIDKANIKVYAASFTESKDVAVLNVAEDDLHMIADYIHRRTGRCGGFFVEEHQEDPSFHYPKEPSLLEEWTDIDQIGTAHREIAEKMIEEVDEVSIRNSIIKLSDFKNRYYKSPHGTASQQWLKDTWERLIAARSDASVSLITHQNWSQPSVQMIITGTTKPDEYVVLGGHGDSISGWRSDPQMLAPGADDNASGVSTITEVIRILGAHPEYKPERSLIFYSYAAEEVGLRGSHEIAQSMKNQNKKIMGAMQLDMTNFKASPEDIVFMTDYTDPVLTSFTKQLITTYLPDITVKDDRCGYACSDHASWNRFGFKSVMPFESRMDDINNAIHTEDDTIANSSSNAKHATSFAKLAAAYIAELGLLN